MPNAWTTDGCEFRIPFGEKSFVKAFATKPSIACDLRHTAPGDVASEWYKCWVAIFKSYLQVGRHISSVKYSAASYFFVLLFAILNSYR